MIKLAIYIVLFLYNINAYSQDYLVKQGAVSVTINDIDGFAFTIPKDNRNGFFSSKRRLSDAVTNILNMKIIVTYGLKENSFDNEELQSQIKEKLMYVPEEFSHNDSMTTISRYNSWKDYITLREEYKQIQLYMKAKIDREPLVELASEMYMLNKQDYYTKESRDIDYIAVIFNEYNKPEKRLKTFEILNEMISGMKVSDLESKYKNDVDIEFVKGLNNYIFDSENPKFSEFVFKVNEASIINRILELGTRFVITKINKISPRRLLSFKEVKEKIVDTLVIAKYERDFQFLLSSLVKQNEVKVNTNLLDSIEKRYN